MAQQNRKLTDSPANERTAPAAKPASREFLEAPGVLVVDDEHLVRIMVQLGLERTGFNVWLAANGREAIDLYQTHREDIAVILLDVCMPDLDGPQTLDALRELDPEVPACFMSGDTGAYEQDELLERSAAYVIAKPFLLNDLANILRLLATDVPADLLPSAKLCRW